MTYGIDQSEWDKLSHTFSQYAHIQSAILYGSRAKGNYKTFSDMDITLTGEELTHDELLEISASLDDLLLPYRIDLSIFQHLTNDALIDHIRRVGVTIYQRH